MAFTKIAAAGIGSTETVTLHSLEVLNNATVGGVLTYEDVTNVDSIGIITARSGVLVGSGITLSKDGDIFATGVTTTGSLVSSGAISGTTGTFTGIVDVTGSDSTVRLGGGANRRLQYRSGDNDVILEGASNFFYQQKIADTSHRWYTNGADVKAMISGAGLVGINTDAPTTLLEIDTAASNAWKFRIKTSVSDGAGFYQKANGDFEVVLRDASNNNNHITGVNGSLAFVTSNSEKVRIDTNGKVGIATTNPSGKLHILSGNEAGILIEDNDNGNNAPYLEIMAKRTDANTHQSFSGQVFLSRNRTEQKVSSGLKLGTVLFGGNHTDGSKSNILYPASIAGMSSGDFNSASDMPTDLVFFTGSTGRAPTVANVSSGTERMRINKDGIITMTNKPSFFATLDTGGNNTTTVNNPIAFNITRHNNGNHYDTSNYYFVAPAAGYYFFHAQVWAKNTTGNASIHFYFEDASNSYSGGAVNRSGFHANGLNMQDRTIHQTIVYFMDTGDRMSTRADAQDITYWTAGNSNPHTFFCGYMIG